MPKGQWEPPDAGEGAPQEIKDILRAVYSDYRDKHPAEDPAIKATASQIAWGAVHNAGWEKDPKTGKWVKKQKKENSSPDASYNTKDSGSQGNHGTVQHIRALAMPFSRGQMITEPDGSLLIKDVPMLAEGVWTDSAVGTPLNYIARTLEADAANWLDNSGWNRHVGKVPRASTDKVGEAVNPHFGKFTGDDGREHSAVISDVRVWPFTQNQRDMQEMIRHGLIKYVSVEHGGDERLNPATRQMESASLIFTGFAFVNKGACKLCRLNESDISVIKSLDALPWDECIAKMQKEGYDDETAKKICGAIKARNNSASVPVVVPVEEIMADTKELEDKIATLTKELEAVKAQKPAEVKVEIPKELSELPGQMKELSAIPAVLKTLSDRLDALEKAGTPKTGGSGKELSEPEPMNSQVAIDQKAGTIRRV
jgi:cation transport regulator ChaB/uncharacterized small protein (DUF1192 family)